MRPKLFAGRVGPAVILLCSVALAVVLFRPNMRAQWGPWDDHGILQVLGPAHRASLGSALAQTSKFEELNLPGTGLRYRPSYALVQALEIWLFGDSLTAWYGARILAFGVMVACGWYLLAQAAGPVLGSLFALVLATRPYWARIFACLGPGETFSAPGAVVAILGIYWAWQGGRENNLRRRRIGWLLFSLGSLLAIGCKENMFWLAVPGLALGWWEWRQGRLTALSVCLSGLVAAYAGFVTGAVLLATGKLSQDLYSNPVGWTARFGILLGGLRTYWIVPAALIPALAAWATPFLPRRLSVRWIAWELAVLGVFAIQIVFYNGGWDSATRYAFPGEALIGFALFVPVISFWQERDTLQSSWSGLLWGGGGLLSAALLFVSWHNLQFLSPLIEYNVVVTRKFSTTVQRAAEQARKRPGEPVVLYTRGAGEWEAVSSVPMYLRFLRVENPVVLRVDPHFRRAGWSPAMVEKIQGELASYQSGGHWFAPAHVLSTATGCIEVSGYGPASPGSRCTFAGSLTP
ncbi:hypothetical protein [uncultured Paludibaculum sp.]|uniref:hypothetical protein n=1 Tax=uncultured Paludibaculum sp. TaxID=1765020 RepID=UPI002AAC408F|nr:hypothetical protein [uncultured Paludibaculum sp.]